MRSMRAGSLEGLRGRLGLLIQASAVIGSDRRVCVGAACRGEIPWGCDMSDRSSWKRETGPGFIGQARSRCSYGWSSGKEPFSVGLCEVVVAAYASFELADQGWPDAEVVGRCSDGEVL